MLDSISAAMLSTASTSIAMLAATWLNSAWAGINGLKANLWCLRNVKDCVYL